MKNGKNLTKKQKMFLQTKKLNPQNWLIVKNTADAMEILHKTSRKIKIIKKGV